MFDHPTKPSDESPLEKKSKEEVERLKHQYENGMHDLIPIYQTYVRSSAACERLKLGREIRLRKKELISYLVAINQYEPAYRPIHNVRDVQL